MAADIIKFNLTSSDLVVEAAGEEFAKGTQIDIPEGYRCVVMQGNRVVGDFANELSHTSRKKLCAKVFKNLKAPLFGKIKARVLLVKSTISDNYQADNESFDVGGKKVSVVCDFYYVCGFRDPRKFMDFVESCHFKKNEEGVLLNKASFTGFVLQMCLIHLAKQGFAPFEPQRLGRSAAQGEFEAAFARYIKDDLFGPIGFLGVDGGVDALRFQYL